MDTVFIRYAISSKICQFFIHKFVHPDMHDNMIIESDNIEFFEHNETI